MRRINVEKHDSVKIYKIRRTIEELSKKSGRGTELITVYIPKGRQLHEVIGALQQERGTAANIKSDTTRTHVVDSLGKVIQRLRLYKKTPERGLVVFCGALPPEGGGPLGSEVVRAWEIDPPRDLKQYLYRCDDHFHVDILKGMLRDENLVGFLAIDSKDAGWGLMHGDRIEVLDHTGSGVAGKHRQGGQSAKRFQKLREMELTYFFNRVAQTTRQYFIDIYQVKGLIISGPGPTKEEFVNGRYLEYRLQEAVLATLDTSYAGAEGIREAFAKAGDILSDFRMVEEKRLVESLFREINSHSGLGSYGLEEVIGHIEGNVAGTVLVADDTGLRMVTGTCGRCGQVRRRAVDVREAIPLATEFSSGPCPGCGAGGVEASGQDIVDYLETAASRTGAELQVISGKSESGAMLASLGGAGAILRYNPEHSR
ncbi:MAG: peptide chain release factor aRF-1 [Nitrosopumilus sp.]|nr:peptide chain release factor aRF-1 [Nitrosopumilus sp.]CAI9831320.1 Peptide chain release factor subunit 1 [Nitrosopumilaceae archaeon]MDA7940940.1 peptide chain release factor aRF-1 [Nitrosopumilus sp.]MDA7943204.1 peptide chain release factor aRF-1 [Nitrosopumilus sp.]MDA7944303.1 peptide chain release factor aRF-1 [Nitrosopumilus sp.]